MEEKLCSVVCVLVFAGIVASHNIYSIPSAILSTPEGGSCPSEEKLQTVRNLISIKVSEVLVDTGLGCGGTGWKRVAFLNMTTPNQTCPEQWRLYERGPFRACGRKVSPTGTCDSVKFSTGDTCTVKCVAG